MNDYQRVIVFPGPLFALVLVLGLAGIIIPRRRTAAAGLLWFSAAISIVLPIAEHEYTYRYVVPAIPLACMAAALAFRTRSPAALVPAEAAATAGPGLTPESSGSADRPAVPGTAAGGR
jgi:peptidoglycan/LPS O-acetylase OafA/YrhL